MTTAYRHYFLREILVVFRPVENGGEGKPYISTVPLFFS